MTTVPLSPDASLRHSIFVLDSDRILINGGRRIVVIDSHDRTNKTFFDTTHSIGAIAIHNDASILAIGEKRWEPSPEIVLYSTTNKSFHIIQRLKNGALEAYNAMDFNKNGKWLASVLFYFLFTLKRTFR